MGSEVGEGVKGETDLDFYVEHVEKGQGKTQHKFLILNYCGSLTKLGKITLSLLSAHCFVL